MRDFFIKAKEDGWLKPVINILGTTIKALCAWMLGSSEIIQLVALLLLALFLILMIIIEILFSKSYNQIRSKAREDAIKETEELRIAQEDLIKNTSSDLELASETIGFLTTRNRKITDYLMSLPSEHKSIKSLFEFGKIDRIEMISKTLEGLCHALVNSAKVKGFGTRASIMFRSTYMVITRDSSGERLEYLAFYTPDNHVPRSMLLKKTFIKNVGCAGISWFRCRPVIEDKFEEGKEWESNYLGQGRLYNSMLCVPVTLFTSSDCADVVGVITVDTNIAKFFGTKDNRDDEERGARWIRPFGNFISVIEAFSSLETRIVQTKDKNSQ